MKHDSPFDPALAHKWFSAEYFNGVWALLGETDRTMEEGERMISMCHASLAHWRERPDCGPREMSVGWWQLARVYGVLKQAENARHYGVLSLAAAADEPPFYAGYAHEALARAAKVAGNEAAREEHLGKAAALAARVEDHEERSWLEADLALLRG